MQEGRNVMTHSPSNLTISVVTPTGGFRVSGSVNGWATSFLVDTGAAVTLVREDAWKKISTGTQRVYLQPWSKHSLVGVDGTSLQVNGQAKIDLSLEGHCYPTDIVVVIPLTTEAILGLDFMKKNEVTVDLGKGQIFIGKQPTVQIHQKPRFLSQAVSVCIKESIRLPPFSEQVVMACVEECSLEGTCIVEKLPGNLLPCAILRALVEPHIGKVPVRFLNPKPEPTVIPKNTRVASIETVEPPPEVVITNVPIRSDQLTPGQDEFLWSIVENVGLSLVGNRRSSFSLVSRYSDVFATSNSDLGRTDKLHHPIYTGKATPVRQAVRRNPPHRRQVVRDIVDSMLKDKVVQPSKSPWASPIVLVRKKDNSFRFGVDYRKLNEVTRKDAYPLPRIDDTLNTLAGSRWFSTLDLLSGYWQVEVAKEDRPKTAFCTTEGLFEFRVMPFGLCNAPANFQRLMDLVLAGLQWSHCLVYLDDVIILGKTFIDHLANLELVFEWLHQAGMKLKPKKFDFLKHKVQYLGHIVSDEGVAADSSKLKKVATWQVQQFLGFAGYYRRFIQDFTKIAWPLHKLTEHKALFRWTPECQSAFDRLKQHLVTSPVLAYPDYSKPFILDTDASDTGIGAVLSQVDDEGRERAVAYASRLLSKPERQYCVTRRELLAVVVFSRHFRSFLLGRSFLLRTDHGSLTWLKNFKEPEGQMAGWLERLQQFGFTIVHRRGRKHTNADSLSRLPCRQCGRGSQVDVTTIATTCLAEEEGLHQLQLADPTIGPVLSTKLQDTKPLDSDLKAMSR